MHQYFIEPLDVDSIALPNKRKEEKKLMEKLNIEIYLP